MSPYPLAPAHADPEAPRPSGVGCDLHVCTGCRQELPSSGFYHYFRTDMGKRMRHPKCKRCHGAGTLAAGRKNKKRKNERMRDWRDRHREWVNEQARGYRSQIDADAQREKDREYRERNRERVMARRKVRYAVKSGALVRPDTCAACHSAERKIHAHHPDYSRPLVVEWLCSRCHIRLHKLQEAA